MKDSRLTWEHRIGEAVFGINEAKMQDVFSRKVLSQNIEEYGKTNPDTRLKVNTTGRNPDEGLSDIPYEKAMLFCKPSKPLLVARKWMLF